MRLPGFVDLQVNGTKGANFSADDVSDEQMREICRHALASGTAAMLPTVTTAPESVYRRNLPMLAGILAEDEFAGRLPGLHIEGPFISPEPGAVGAHRPECVHAPDPDFFARMQEWAEGSIRLLTIAAEVEGAEALCRKATDMGVTVSLGHQLAMEDDLARLAEAGAKAITHFGNGVPNMIPRHPNTLWAGLAEERLTAMIIADGHHLPPCVIKATLLAKGVEKTIVVSDASAMSGMPPGEYHGMHNRIVLEPSGKLWNPDKGCLVGSSAMMLDCMNFLAGLDILSLDEMRTVGFDNPLRLIGLDPAETDFPEQIEYEPGKGFSTLAG